MIAVDVNVIAYLWLPGEYTGLAERALERDAHWVAPFLWRSEFRSILAGYLRRGAMDRAAATRCLQGAERQLDGREYLVPSHLVTDKIAASSCSAYDCEYVALADDLDLKLVTCDRQILRDFPALTVGLEAFGEG